MKHSVVSTDSLSPEQRSAHIRVASKNDRLQELAVRRAAHALGLRFRLNRRGLLGSPDLVFPRHRKLIFVHNCFWHQHPGCRQWRLPSSRFEYWRSKLERTIEHDRQAEAGLRALGWGVLVVWECETRDDAALQGRIRAFFRPPGD